ncbi:post-GPI attachment to proteins factor 2-like [Eupeodes corollae]|uniref:post-GPI attachment to proteins factor 2-like n=1 Tax=Eupeodes corollae TaxID=290404 RepID=UPI0024935A82|nr:post-GPI attachment to proteins factor 2-like [Eupeodes corollae]
MTTTTTNDEIQSRKAEENPIKKDPNLPEKHFVVHFLASFHDICVVTAMLPLFTLLCCFVSAYVFQADEVHETHCRVYNIIPSISAITGVSPQRYFWRISIALHIGPRLPIAVVYRNYYRSLISKLNSPESIKKAEVLARLVFWLNAIEITSLGGVTYISNRENYPLHEKIFIIFMTCSLCHMLATIKLYSILHDEESITDSQRVSLKWKKILFAISILSTIGLLVFFAKHRFYCHDLAFSVFAFCEYVIAVANMCFHFTIIWDFPSQYMFIAQGPLTLIEDHICKPAPSPLPPSKSDNETETKKND